MKSSVTKPAAAVEQCQVKSRKGHVPNQSLYKGWEQSFPCFFLDQKMDITFCQDAQFIDCRNQILFILIRL